MDGPSFVDIHCHILPGIDDGSESIAVSLEMARIAVADGITAIVATPHQLGGFAKNSGDAIRRAVDDFQALLDAHQIPLQMAPGADIRIEDGMLAGLRSGSVVSLADHKRHVLLELPHELYFDLVPVLEGLARNGMQGILSHPERNHGILARPHLIDELVDVGCLMQVTAGSLLGTFGPASQGLAESMVRNGQVHFLATDAHGNKSRRPLIARSYRRAAELTHEQYAIEMCCDNPRRVWDGKSIQPGLRETRPKARSWFQWGTSRASAATAR